MNKLFKHYSTPAGQLRMKEFLLTQVSSGASGHGEDRPHQWDHLTVRFAVDDATDTTYSLRMDRETAARIAQNLNEYLAEPRRSS